MRLSPALLLILAGCTGTYGLLGGQEGEPVTTPRPPPEDDLDTDIDSGACTIVEHCEGTDWCEDSSVYGISCDEPVESGACDSIGATGYCSDGDVCGRVWLFGAESPEVFCNQLGMGYVPLD